MTYDNIKSHKKPGFHLSLEDTLSKKPWGEGGQIDPPAILGLKHKSKIVWVLILLLIISILLFLEFYGGKPELYRLF